MSALMLLTPMPGFKGEETDRDSDHENDLYPQLLTTFDEENKPLSDDLVLVKCNFILSNYQWSHDQCSNLVLSTRIQIVSQQNGRIAGTKTHDVLVRRETTPPDNSVTDLSTFLPKLLWNMA